MAEVVVIFVCQQLRSYVGAAERVNPLCDLRCRQRSWRRLRIQSSTHSVLSCRDEIEVFVHTCGIDGYVTLRQVRASQRTQRLLELQAGQGHWLRYVHGALEEAPGIHGDQ